MCALYSKIVSFKLVLKSQVFFLIIVSGVISATASIFAFAVVIITVSVVIWHKRTSGYVLEFVRFFLIHIK